ncbi:hypothetical protein GCM10022409_00860 [Hymenobacter glaciei]|uniref:BLUF domain-containing protein n=2 Tax=Hymenobacter glaciei TaxID=877209 RepID=A0ABP7T4U5_9BACT
MSLYQLIYQSYSLIPFEPQELQELLDKSRVRNQRHHITGLLLYTPDGRFLQALEGPREAVRDLYYQHIVADPRHYNCQVLGEGPSETSSFANNALAFRPAQAQDLRQLLAPVRLQGAALLVPRPHTRPELTELLVEFMRGELTTA